jgi:hypothetical protein
MPAPRSLDAGTDRLPKSMRSAQGQKLDWKAEARCRPSNRPGLPDFAWTVVESDSGPLLLGRDAETWIEMALMICRSCPAQYDCARFALATDERFGTWAMPLEDLKLLKKQRGRDRILDIAEANGMPVQEAVAVALRHG